MIHRLKIANFKSIDSLEISSLSSFSVFAGPNGAGKSNFFDALGFVSQFIQGGLDFAARNYGGFENIRSLNNFSSEFQFELDCELSVPNQPNLNHYQYKLIIHNIDTKPQIEECLILDNEVFLERDKNGLSFKKEDTSTFTPKTNFSYNYSSFILFEKHPITKFIRNLCTYRIDPFKVKESVLASMDSSKLSPHANNLASVLKRIEKDDDKRETIIEWMEIIVPGIESLQTEAGHLDGRTTLLFKESGIDKRFPAHMMSDSTVYALSLLVAVLDQAEKPGLTMIEEPERGVHPKVIYELVELMREHASSTRPIWITTHSESIVRVLKPEELILVDKLDGRTKMKHANITKEQLATLNLDEAWLSDLLNGGVPW